MMLAARFQNFIDAQVRRLADEERGQGMVEYGLIIALVAIAAVVALGALGTKVSTTFSSITSSL